MEKQLSCVSILSLQEMALRKVAILLWNGRNTMLLVENFKNWPTFNCSCAENFPYGSYVGCEHLENWHRSVEYKVSGNVSKLQLPELLRKLMVRKVKPIGLQIIRWKMYHEAFLKNSDELFDKSILQKLHWTAAGTVNYQKTAENLLHCDVLDIVKRYKLSCLYCLESYIPELWKKLPRKIKSEYYDGTIPFMRTPSLPKIWPYILSGEEYKFETDVPFNQLLFQSASSEGNEAAAKYFFQKLSPDEREASLVSAARSALKSRGRHRNTYPSKFPNKNISDVVFYLASLMTPEQQVEIFREWPVNTFQCFLDWPRQDAFLDVCSSLWTWMQCEDLNQRASNYNCLIHTLFFAIKYSDYYRSDLYQNFFLRCPEDFKTHFVEQEISNEGYFLSTLFRAEDALTINVILGIVDAGDRLTLLLSEYLIQSFYFGISIGSGLLVETCLQNIGLSKEDIASLKEALMRKLNKKKCVPNQLETPEWRRFFAFLDEIDQRTEIKRMSDETLTKNKKLAV